MAKETKSNSDTANALINEAGTAEAGKTAATGSTGENGGGLAPGTTTTAQPGENTGAVPLNPQPQATNESQSLPNIPVKQPQTQAPQPNIETKPEEKQTTEKFSSDADAATLAQNVKNVPTEELQSVKRVIDSELASRSQITPANQPTKEEVGAQTRQSLVRQYGEDYVNAKHIDGERQTYFSRVSWNNLVAGKDGSRDGWKEVINVPDEVKALAK